MLVRVIPAQTLELLSRWLFGLPGCLWVLVSAFLPVVMILTLVYLHAVNPRLEEAGRLISRWPAILRYITLPMIWPGILFGGILVFLLALGEVGVPMFLRYPVFPARNAYAVLCLLRFWRCGCGCHSAARRHPAGTSPGACLPA